MRYVFHTLRTSKLRKREFGYTLLWALSWWCSATRSITVFSAITDLSVGVQTAARAPFVSLFQVFAGGRRWSWNGERSSPRSAVRSYVQRWSKSTGRNNTHLDFSKDPSIDIKNRKTLNNTINVDFYLSSKKKTPNNLDRMRSFHKPNIHTKKFENRKVRYIIIHEFLRRITWHSNATLYKFNGSVDVDILLKYDIISHPPYHPRCWCWYPIEIWYNFPSSISSKLRK